MKFVRSKNEKLLMYMLYVELDVVMLFVCFLHDA